MVVYLLKLNKIKKIIIIYRKKVRSEKIMAINEIGNKYGKLTVIASTPERIRNRICWICKCECGK